MSRIEDDREDALAAARVAEARRTAEAKNAKKAGENQAFSKLVNAGKQQQTQAQQQSAAKSAIEQLLEAAESGEVDLGQTEQRTADARTQQGAFQSRLGQASSGERAQSSSKQEGAGVEARHAADDHLGSVAAEGRGADAGEGARRSEGRKGDSRSTRATLEDRKSGSDAEASARGAVGAKGGKGALKADADQGGGGQQGGSKDQKDAQVAPNFRFNPALMAPVPVARAKEATGSDRLRKVANELAQKIVEKVRVGTNALGRMEFQVDLRNDVLSGLTVKVSAHNGKIKAVFQGRDTDVLKLIEEHGEALKTALTARGLTLEEFKTEARP
jgi:hypothetical protein